jgi:hypothetical protein
MSIMRETHRHEADTLASPTRGFERAISPVGP